MIRKVPVVCREQGSCSERVRGGARHGLVSHGKGRVLQLHSLALHSKLHLEGGERG